jgi:uncharacterized protein (DUF58 family)
VTPPDTAVGPVAERSGSDVSVTERHAVTERSGSDVSVTERHTVTEQQSVTVATRLRTLAAPALPVLRRIASPVTPLGAIAIAGVLACAAIGLLTGWSEFAVVALTGAIMLAISALFLIGRSSYAVSIGLHAQRVVAGEQATCALTTVNTGNRRLLPSRIEVPVGASLASFRIPGLAPHADTEDLFVIPTTQRSVITVGPAVSVRGDALGLLRRQVRWTAAQALFVHPRTVLLAGTSTGMLRDLEGQPTRDLSSNDVSFHALRPYVPGDDRRYVHWRTSARTGALMVRQFEETRRTHMALALSADPAEYDTAEEFELAVSVAASLGVQAIREERPVTVCVGPRAVPAPSAQRLLDGFSGVRTLDGAGLLRSALAAATAVPNASVGVLVCGSQPDAAVIRRAGTAFSIGIRVVAVRAACGQPVALSGMGGIDVGTVGRLSDLATVMRRMRAV